MTGKDVVHLCCNNGRELLSIKKMGAANCVGFDISCEFIDQARRLAVFGSVSCQFIESDVYEISHEFDRQFDVCVLTSNCRPDHSCLDEVQTEWLTKVGVTGKDVVHLCCNNGRELLSIKKMGAANCVGFDISRASACSSIDMTVIRISIGP